MEAVIENRRLRLEILKESTRHPGVNVSVFHASFNHVIEDLREDSCDDIRRVILSVRTVDDGPCLEAFLRSSMTIIQCALGRDRKLMDGR